MLPEPGEHPDRIERRKGRRLWRAGGLVSSLFLKKRFSTFLGLVAFLFHVLEPTTVPDKSLDTTEGVKSKKRRRLRRRRRRLFAFFSTFFGRDSPS